MNDIFAQIATDRRQARYASLIAPVPEAMPDLTLPLDGMPGTHAFAPTHKMSTHAASLALADLRSRKAPFLADLAPALPQERLTLELAEFDWHEETGTDRRDALGVLAGRGAWTKMAIPHYGPPLGRAVTYYRTSLKVSEAMLSKGSLWACFDGVDYKAHVFVNGAYLGSHEGFFAPFEFDFTSSAVLRNQSLADQRSRMTISAWGARGALTARSLTAISFTPLPARMDGVGLASLPAGDGHLPGREIEARQRQFIRDLYVRPLPAANEICWIEVYNCDLSDQNDHVRPFVVRSELPANPVCQPSRDPHYDRHPRPRRPGQRVAAGDPAAGWPGISQYHVSFDLPDARVWDLDTPWLYQLQVSLLDDAGIVRDARSSQFGIREFRQDEESTPKGKFYLNGCEIRLRGANCMGFEQVSVMRQDWDRLIDDILLAKLCNMNFLRLTQRPVQREVYEFSDRLGLLTQTDLPLFGCLRRNQLCEAVRQAEEMERLVRSHACNIMVSYINEPFPNGIGQARAP